MNIKHKFLTYVELQKSANDLKFQIGTNNPRTAAAYDKANTLKRELLNIFESIEEEL